MIDVVTYNNLVTENTELKKHLAAAQASLRDELAMAALPACIGKCHQGWEKTSAETAYKLADAMMEARKK